MEGGEGGVSEQEGAEAQHGGFRLNPAGQNTEETRTFQRDRQLLGTDRHR